MTTSRAAEQGKPGVSMPFFRRRVVWLGLVCAALLVVAVAQRSRFVGIPHSQVYRGLALHDLELARWWLAVAERIAPDNAESEFLRARICRRTGDMRGMHEHLANSRSLGFSLERVMREEWLAAAQEGQMSQAEPHLSELLTDPRGEAPEICEAYVFGYLRLRQFPVADRLLSSWHSDFPANPQPLYLRANILREETRWDDAKQCLQQALAVRPAHGPSAALMGEVLLATQEPEPALEFFARAEKIAETRDRARLGRAQALSALGRRGEAREALDELLAADPTQNEAILALAQIDLAEGEYADALERLQPALDKEPRNADLLYAHATALRGVGKVEEASLEFEGVARDRKLLQEARELTGKVVAQPADIASRFRIGQIYLQLGSRKEGLIWLQSVLNYDPAHRETHQVLARFYTERARTEPEYSELAKRHTALAESQ